MADICNGDWCVSCEYEFFDQWMNPCAWCTWDVTKQKPNFYHKKGEDDET